MNPEARIAATVDRVASTLDDRELACINNAMQTGCDPRPVHGYEKAQSLFDGRTVTGVPVAHDLTRRAYAQVVLRRLAPP